MILIDVEFPEMNRTIDFQVDETAAVWDIVDEIAAMAAQTCGKDYLGTERQIFLYSWEQRRALNLNLSLRDNQVNSGDHLLMI